MIVEIKVHDLGETINEVEIGEWLVDIGGRVKLDDELVEVESEKATVEIPSPQEGILVEILKKQGETAAIGEVIGRLDTEEGGKEKVAAEPDAGQEKEPAQAEKATRDIESDKGESPEPAPEESRERKGDMPEGSKVKVMPAAARILAEHDISPETVTPTGPGGRLLKEDVLRAVEDRPAAKVEKVEKKEEPEPSLAEEEISEDELEHRVAMTPIRRTIAARLLEAKQNMALLTTFNEVDMSEVKKARTLFGKEFAEKYGVRLGFMSFFVKASVAALLDFPRVNARIEGRDIVYSHSCDIGVAIGGGKGLVVPVVRRAERLGFADIENKIGEFAEKAKDNSLTMDELQGGTFTISNGGIYGSMLSTPIVNPPQSAILGLHAIKDRPVAIDGEVVIRPIMYLALTYDHRIIDGREAVTFLKSIKERIEDPRKLLLEI